MKEVCPWHTWTVLSNQTRPPIRVPGEHQVLKVPALGLIIETSAVWPWCRMSFQDTCRGMWIIIAELTCGLFPMIFRMVFPSCLFLLDYYIMPTCFSIWCQTGTRISSYPIQSGTRCQSGMSPFADECDLEWSPFVQWNLIHTCLCVPYWSMYYISQTHMSPFDAIRVST
jgi:hypothetical protein